MVTNSSTNLPTGTSGQIPVGQGTGVAPAFVTPTAGTGLSVTANTTTHSYALSTPVSTANGGTGQNNYTGNRVLLGTQTASSSTSLVFNSWSTGYLYYLCEFIEIIPTTNSTRLQIAFSTDGGSSYTNVTWDNGGFDAASTGGGTFVANSGASATPDLLLGNTQANVSDEGINGWLYLWGLDSSTYRKTLHQYITHPTGTNSMTFRNIGYHVRLTTQVTGLRFTYNGAGGITSGTINFYGVSA